MRFFTSGKENDSTTISSRRSNVPVVVPPRSDIKSEESSVRKFGTPLQQHHHRHTSNNNLGEPQRSVSKRSSTPQKVVVPGSVKKVVRVRRTPKPSTSVFLSPPPPAPPITHTNELGDHTSRLSSLTSTTTTAKAESVLLSDERTTNEKTVLFAPGPVGLQLEPINEDPFYGCRVVRFIDGGPKDPGQARKSGKIQPGDLVMKVEAEGSWMGATTYDEMVNLLKLSNVRRVLTIQSVWTDEMTTTSSELPPPTNAQTWKGFIPTQKIRPTTRNAGRNNPIKAGHRSSRIMGPSETTMLPSPILRTPHRNQKRQDQLDDETMDFSTLTGLAADIDWIHSPSDMVLLAHSAQEQSRFSASSRSCQPGNDGPIIVELNNHRVEQDTETDHSSTDDNDGDANVRRAIPSQNESFSSQHTSKSSNRSALTATPRQSLADQFLLVDGYTGPLVPDSPYVSSAISSEYKETTSNDTTTTKASIHQSVDEEAGLLFTSRISQTPARQSALTNKLGADDGKEYDPILILQADFDERVDAIQMEYATKEKELKDLYVQTCERNDVTIRELQMANQRLQKEVEEYKNSVDVAEQRCADADDRFHKAQREIKSKADAIKEQSNRMMKMEQTRQTEITNLERQNARLQDESSTRAMELNMARTMVSELEDRIRALETDKDDLIRRMEAALHSNQVLEESVNNKDTLIASQGKELKDLENSMKGLSSEFETYRTNSIAAAVESDRVLVEMKAVENSLSSDLQSRNEQVSRLEQDLERDKVLLQEQHNQNLIIGKRVQELEVFKQEASALSETLARSVQEKNKIISQSQTATSMLQKENDSLLNQVNAMTKDLEALLQEKLAMDGKLAQAWKDVDVARKETSTIHESLLQKLENGEFYANEEIESKESLIEELRHEIVDLKEASKVTTTKVHMGSVLLQLVARVHEQEQENMETSLALACESRHVLTDELKVLREKLMNDEIHVQALTQQLAATQSMVEHLQGKLDASAVELEERTQEQQVQLESLSSELKTKELTLASNEARLYEVETELHEVIHVRRTLESTYTSLIDERAETERTILAEKEMLQRQLNAVSSELGFAQSQIAQATEDNDRVTAENQEIKERLECSIKESRRIGLEFAADMETINSALRLKDGDVLYLTSRLQTIAANHDLALFEKEQLSSKMECLLVEHDSSNDFFGNETRSLKLSLETLQVELSAQTARYRDLRQEKDDVVWKLSSRLQTSVDDHDEALFKVEQLSYAMEGFLLERAKSNTTFRNEIQLLRHSLETVQKEFSSQSTRYLTLEDEYLSLKIKADKLEHVVKSTESGWMETNVRHGRELEMLKSEVKLKDDELSSNSKRLQEMIDTNESITQSLEVARQELRAAMEHHEVTEERLQNVIELMTVDLNASSATLVSLQSRVNELEHHAATMRSREISLQKMVDTIRAQNDEATRSHSLQIDKVVEQLSIKSVQLNQARSELQRRTAQTERLSFSEEQLRCRQELLSVERELSDQNNHRLIMSLSTEVRTKSEAISSIERRTHGMQNKLDLAQFKEEQLMYKLDSSYPLKALNELEQLEKVELNSNMSITDKGRLEETKTEILTPLEIDCFPEKKLQSENEPLLEMVMADRFASERAPTSAPNDDSTISLTLAFASIDQNQAESDTIDMKIELSILRKRLSWVNAAKNEATARIPLELQDQSRGRNRRLYDVAKRDNELLQSRIHTLESLLRSKEEEIVEMGQETDVFSTTVANLRFELMEKDEEHKIIRRDLEFTRYELDQLKAAVGIMSLSALQRNQGGVNELSEIRDIVGKQSDRISELEDILVEAERCAEDACKSLALAQQSEEVQRKMFSSRQESMLNELVKLKKANHDKLLEVERQASKRLDEFEDREKSFEFDLGSMTEEMKSLVLHNTALKNNLEKAETMLAGRTVDTDRLLIAVTDLSAKINEKDRLAKSLQSELDILSRTVTEMKSDREHYIHLLQKQVMSLVAALIQKHLRKRRLQETLDVEKTDLLKNVADLSSNLISMEKQLETVENAHLVVENSLKRSILKLRAEYVSCYLEGTSLRKRVASLLDEGRMAQGEIKELNESIVGLRLERDEMSQLMTNVQEECKLEIDRLRKMVIQQSMDLRKGREEKKMLAAISESEVIALSSSMRSLEEETQTAKALIQNELELALKSVSEQESLVHHLKSNLIEVQDELADERAKVAELMTSRGVEAEKAASLLATCHQLEAKASILAGEVSAKQAIVMELRDTIEAERQTTSLTIEERIVEMDELRLQLSRVSREMEARNEELNNLASMRKSDLEEIRTLRIEKERFIQCIGNLEDTKQLLEKKMTTLVEDLTNLRRILPVKEIQSRQTQLQISALQDELQSEKSNQKHLILMQESMASKLNEHLEESERLSMRVVDLEQENSNLTRTISNLDMELNKEREQLHELDVARELKEESLSSLGSRCEDQARIICALEEERSQARANISSLEIEVEAGQSKIFELANALESGAEEMSALRSRTSEVTRRNIELQEIQVALEGQVASMERDLEEERSNVKTQADDLCDMRAKLQCHETQANDNINALTMQVETLRNENELIRSDLSASTFEVKTLSQIGASKSDQILGLSEENESLLRQIEQMKVDLSNSVNDVERRDTILENEVESLQIDLDRVSAELLVKTNTLIQLENKHAVVRDDLAKMTSVSQNLQSRLQDYESKVHEITCLKQQAREKERYIMELEDEMDDLRRMVVSDETSLELSQQTLQHVEKLYVENQSNVKYTAGMLRNEGCDPSQLDKSWFPRSGEQESSEHSSPLKAHLASVKSAFHTQKAILEDLKLSETVFAKFMQEVMALLNQTEKEVLGLSGRLTTVEELHISPTKLLSSLDLAGLETSKGYIDDVRTRLEGMASLAYTTSAELKIRQKEFLEWQANRVREPAIPITPFKPTKRQQCDVAHEHPDDRVREKYAGAMLLCSVMEKKSKMQLASAFRKWSCTVGAMKASASHKETAIALAQQLEITREKLITLKTSLQGKKNNGKPRLRRILDRLDSNSSLTNRAEEMNSLGRHNDSFGL